MAKIVSVSNVITFPDTYLCFQLYMKYLFRACPFYSAKEKKLLTKP